MYVVDVEFPIIFCFKHYYTLRIPKDVLSVLFNTSDHSKKLILYVPIQGLWIKLDAMCTEHLQHTDVCTVMERWILSPFTLCILDRYQ